MGSFVHLLIPNWLINTHRVFSRDIILSPNMAASIATNQYSFMQASFNIIVCNGFSMNFSICGSSSWWSRVRMVHVTALDIQVSLCNPMTMLEDSMTSVKMLFWGTMGVSRFEHGKNLPSIPKNSSTGNPMMDVFSGSLKLMTRTSVPLTSASSVMDEWPSASAEIE